MSSASRRVLLLLILPLAVPLLAACNRTGNTARSADVAQASVVPVAESRSDTVHFAVIGDTGTGAEPQYRVAAALAASRSAVPFDFVLMLGDNLYGVEDRAPLPSDYGARFERPYAGLLEGGVKFYASLGNHDRIEQTQYEPFNMSGRRYYTFRPRGSSVRFFALDSNNMDDEQLSWLEQELKQSGSDWKVAFFHHPIYSSGMEYGPDVALRARIEPLFMKYGLDVAFAGHEHFYERIKPQNGVQYFISGNGGKLRRGNIRSSGMTESGYDQGRGFMLVSVAGEQLTFQALEERGRVVDRGVVTRARRR